MCFKLSEDTRLFSDFVTVRLPSKNQTGELDVAVSHSQASREEKSRCHETR
jgi:hypothetical protein